MSPWVRKAMDRRAARRRRETMLSECNRRFKKSEKGNKMIIGGGFWLLIGIFGVIFYSLITALPMACTEQLKEIDHGRNGPTKL